jgi:hypothetical protein
MRVLPEKIIVAQLVKESPAFVEPRIKDQIPYLNHQPKIVENHSNPILV